MASDHALLQVSGAQLETKLREQVVLSWADNTTARRRFLGHLSLPGIGKASLTLHVGMDSSDNVLINVHVSLKLRPTIHDRPRDVFMVIPVEQLSLSVHATDDASVHSIDEAARQYVGVDALEVRCRLQHDAFVVMPIARRSVGRSLTGAPAEIVACLRSLSEVKHMVLYLADKPSSRCCLSAISNAEALTTPTIDYAATYPNGLRAGVNAWADYPLDERRGSSTAWNPLVDDEPPSYDAVLSNAPGVVNPPGLDVDVDAVDTGDGAGDTGEGAVDTGEHAVDIGERASPRRKRKAEEELSDISYDAVDTTGIASSSNSDSTYQPTLSPTEVVPTQPENPSVLTQHEDTPPPSRQPRVSSAEDTPPPSHQPRVSPAPSVASLDARLTAAAAAHGSPHSLSSVVPATFPSVSNNITRPRSVSSHSLSQATRSPSRSNNTPRPRSVSNHSPSPYRLVRTPRPPNNDPPLMPRRPSPAGTESPGMAAVRLDLLENVDLFIDLTHFVRELLSVLPTTPSLCTRKLLRIGYLARLGEVERFDALRNDILSQVIDKAASEAHNGGEPIGRAGKKIEGEIERFCRWAHEEVHRSADVYVLDQLVGMRKAEMKVAKIEEEGRGDRAGAFRVWETERASVYTGVLWAYGGRV